MQLTIHLMTKFKSKYACNKIRCLITLQICPQAFSQRTRITILIDQRDLELYQTNSISLFASPLKTLGSTVFSLSASLSPFGTSTNVNILLFLVIDEEAASRKGPTGKWDKSRRGRLTNSHHTRFV